MTTWHFAERMAQEERVIRLENELQRLREINTTLADNLAYWQRRCELAERDRGAMVELLTVERGCGR